MAHQLGFSCAWLLLSYVNRLYCLLLLLLLGGQDAADWSGKHPWKPWDRDTDLEVQMQRPKAAADLLKAAGNLSSRFSSGK